MKSIKVPRRKDGVKLKKKSKNLKWVSPNNDSITGDSCIGTIPTAKAPKPKVFGRNSWRREDDEIIIIPKPAEQKYCLFFCRLGRCRLGNKWWVQNNINGAPLNELNLQLILMALVINVLSFLSIDSMFEHDPTKVAMCRSFLRGKCQDTNCLLSHRLDSVSSHGDVIVAESFAADITLLAVNMYML
jgi:hypothetical protein